MEKRPEGQIWNVEEEEEEEEEGSQAVPAHPSVRGTFESERERNRESGGLVVTPILRGRVSIIVWGTFDNW
jgi:hypothetical protein